LTEDHEPLQDYAALILEDVLERAAADGSLVYKDGADENS